MKRAGYALSTMNGYVNVLLILLHRAVDDFDVLEEFPLKKRLKRLSLMPSSAATSDMATGSARFAVMRSTRLQNKPKNLFRRSP